MVHWQYYGHEYNMVFAVSNPFRAGQWFTEAGGHGGADEVYAGFKPLQSGAMVHCREIQKAIRAIEPLVSNPFRAGQWFTEEVSMNCSKMIRAFQTPSERGNGSLEDIWKMIRLASLCFKPLQSGAMVHCNPHSLSIRWCCWVSNPFRAGQWFTDHIPLEWRQEVL